MVPAVLLISPGALSQRAHLLVSENRILCGNRMRSSDCGWSARQDPKTLRTRRTPFGRLLVEDQLPRVRNVEVALMTASFRSNLLVESEVQAMVIHQRGITAGSVASSPRLRNSLGDRPEYSTRAPPFVSPSRPRKSDATGLRSASKLVEIEV